MTQYLIYFNQTGRSSTRRHALNDPFDDASPIAVDCTPALRSV